MQDWGDRDQRRQSDSPPAAAGKGCAYVDLHVDGGFPDILRGENSGRWVVPRPEVQECSQWPGREAWGACRDIVAVSLSSPANDAV